MQCFPVISLEAPKKIKKHFNQNRYTLDRVSNLRSQRAKQKSQPFQGNNMWFMKVSQNASSLFWKTFIHLLWF